MLQDDDIREILERAMSKHFGRIRPAARYLFEHQRPDPEQPRTVTIHKWALAPVNRHDSGETLQRLVDIAVRDVAAMATTITAEIVFRRPRYLPALPLWRDGLPLFDEHGGERFGLPGGNVRSASGHLPTDIVAAAQRLELLDESYPGDESLMLFCAKPMEKKLVKAAAWARVPCRVFGLFNFKDERSWVLTRDRSPCSLFIGKPAFKLPVEGSKVVVGARFVVWINDPRYAVCVTT